MKVNTEQKKKKRQFGKAQLKNNIRANLEEKLHHMFAETKLKRRTDNLFAPRD